MADHTVKGYLSRLSSEELVAFLHQCTRLNQWKKYHYAVLLITDILKKRNYTIPNAIRNAWEMYLQSIVDNPQDRS